MQTIAPYIKKSVKEDVEKAYASNHLSEVAHILLTQYYDVVYKKPHHVDLTLHNDHSSITVKALEILHTELSSR